MKTKYFYIHGYGSSINSDTLYRFKTAGYDIDGLTYDVTDPETSIELMSEEITRTYINYDWAVIIGSSLGGWYTERLTSKVSAEFILFNPAIRPSETLKKLGVHSEIYKKYDIDLLKDAKPASRTVLVAIDDTVIDYRDTETLYKTLANIKYTSGGHRMTDESFKDICAILETSRNKV